ELERRTGRPVAHIFEKEGEAYFRSLELQLTRDLASRRGMVLAPGGGWPCVPGALELLRPPARVAYLRLTPSSALRRMSTKMASRPLLKGPDPLGTLTALLERRRPRYELADAVIDVELIDSKYVTDAVCALAPVFGSE
ncbi:MAG: shikimate kinase, partial [Gemmatimonadaceae bacterium]